jgi:hypothetical protein
MVVIIIILMLMFMAILMFNQIFRGQEVRTAGRMLEQSMAHARELAAMKGRCYHIWLYNWPTGKCGLLRIYEDTDRNGAFTGGGVDKMVDGSRIELPKFCYFGDPAHGITPQMYPARITLTPTGYARFSGGVSRGAFDTNFNGTNPTLMGDVVIVLENKPHHICIDIDKTAGKVRRQEYLFIE